MKTHSIDKEKILLPGYILDALKDIPWLADPLEPEKNLFFHHDDMIVVLFGVRGSTAYSGPQNIRYGSNTTSFQVWSPKLPQNVMYLGDGGSGVLETNQVIPRIFKNKGGDFFTQKTPAQSAVLDKVINFYTHYHYDHLALGAPLAGLFHANGVDKMVIGGDNPKQQFRTAFKRPQFPREFGEIQAAYGFHEITDPRSSVLIFTPDGDFKDIPRSLFEDIMQSEHPQIKHRQTFHNIDDCLVVKLYNCDHPDPTISFRFENYDSTGKLQNSFLFMTDHELTPDDMRNTYFRKHVSGANAAYFDGQYNEKNFVAGYGHGRVELIGQLSSELNIKNATLIGHHDPSRSDEQIDQMITEAVISYNENVVIRNSVEGAEQKKMANIPGDEESIRIAGASDRMMIFIPGKSRGRNGVVFGRMTFKDQTLQVQDAIGGQNVPSESYHSFDLTQKYDLVDLTKNV